MRCAIYCANFGSLADPALLVDLAVRAEAAGWDGFFVYDHIVLRRDRVVASVDPWTVLAAVAARTDELLLGPMVTPLARRRPWELAHQVLALDRLSEGRLVLGVGLGALEDFAAFGDVATDRERGERLDEGLDVLTRLLAGEVVEHAGTWRVDGVGLAPGPVDGHVPIWVAGRYPHHRPLRRAARHDGVFPINTDWRLDGPLLPAQLAEMVAVVTEHRQRTEQAFAVVQAGVSLAEPHAAAQSVAPYRDAGATWWLEVLEQRRGPVDELKRRIDAGPPRLDG